MASHLDLISRIRTHRSTTQLDATTAQLLLDAEAAIVRLEAGRKPLTDATAPDFHDTSFIPGAETQEALLTAALDHSDATNSTAFVVPVPNTAPELVVAFGVRETLVDILGDQLTT